MYGCVGGELANRSGHFITFQDISTLCVHKVAAAAAVIISSSLCTAAGRSMASDLSSLTPAVLSVFGAKRLGLFSRCK